jgi:ABC-type bacteriocin/lantibiotic exporter with double-glycine peptidase domain
LPAQSGLTRGRGPCREAPLRSSPRSPRTSAPSAFRPLTTHGRGSARPSGRPIHGSIRDNIRFCRKSISDRHIAEALEFVGLRSAITEMPIRLDTIVGEGLTDISAGQRQRILLARAICGQPRLLLIDEATNSLDVKAESDIMVKLRGLGITVIICAHRPDVWKHADRVLLVNGGTVSAAPAFLTPRASEARV